MTAREWLNVLAILNSIDDVPGMPATERFSAEEREGMFRRNPVLFFRQADDATQFVIWAQVQRRLAGGA